MTKQPTAHQRGKIDTAMYVRVTAAQAIDGDRVLGWPLEAVVDRSQLDFYIKSLREGETRVRRFRKRLEALRDDADRVCDRNGCSRNVVGRSDARYCSPDCRVAAHRERRR